MSGRERRSQKSLLGRAVASADLWLPAAIMAVFLAMGTAGSLEIATPLFPTSEREANVAGFRSFLAGNAPGQHRSSWQHRLALRFEDGSRREIDVPEAVGRWPEGAPVRLRQVVATKKAVAVSREAAGTTEPHSLVAGSFWDALLLVAAPLGLFAYLWWRFVLSPLPRQRPIPPALLAGWGIASLVAGIAWWLVD